ncbi:KaiA family protein [Nodularia sp. NIES-3585]|uniref:KaiA family protein n=1 Tax=Nodularia sp. NIES-3585 TaxID=1973477 RepID=UPI000B5C4DF2|nr:KaiA family protein [Nodularia sp. NIES-3585]GAX35177.1 KaiA family protein [Nodularia sp. NIES-3585]
MLLLLLIFTPNVPQNLDHPAKLATRLRFSGNLRRLLQHTTDHLCFSLIIDTTTAKIYYLLKWWQQYLNKNFINKYFYVFPWQKQKPQHFFSQMTQVDRQVLLQQLKSDYRQILINYFTADKTLTEEIDKFIHAVFCANIPVPQIIEFHMELIEDFSIQLRLEGRSDEALLDYRLALIDILAHLCEHYRCSISQ